MLRQCNECLRTFRVDHPNDSVCQSCKANPVVKPQQSGSRNAKNPMRKCTKCKKSKPIATFRYTPNANKFYNECKRCRVNTARKGGKSTVVEPNHHDKLMSYICNQEPKRKPTKKAARKAKSAKRRSRILPAPTVIQGIQKYTVTDKTPVVNPYRARYEAYLKSKEWRAKRNEYWIHPDYPNECYICGAAKHIGMQMHHVTYDTLYNESLDDIVPACATCNFEASRLHKLLPESQRTTRRESNNRVTLLEVTDYMREYFSEHGELPTDLPDLK